MIENNEEVQSSSAPSTGDMGFLEHLEELLAHSSCHGSTLDYPVFHFLTT